MSVDSTRSDASLREQCERLTDTQSSVQPELRAGALVSLALLEVASAIRAGHEPHLCDLCKQVT
jgi:hypothetical protein